MFSIDEIMGARAYDLLYAEERDDARTLRWRGKGRKLLKEPVYHRCARYHKYSLFDSQAIDTPAKKKRREEMDSHGFAYLSNSFAVWSHRAYCGDFKGIACRVSRAALVL